MTDIRAAARRICELGEELSRRGLLPATSGNLSIRIDAGLHYAITRSGADKGRLHPGDILVADGEARVVGRLNASGERDDDGISGADILHKPSAETFVHALLYKKETECHCILHVHSVWNNLLSHIHYPRRRVSFADHELLKALGHWEPDARINLPIVDNHHDLRLLAQAVADAAAPDVPGVLVRDHGIYAWGDSAEAALRHLEAWEFLSEYAVRLHGLGE